MKKFNRKPLAEDDVKKKLSKTNKQAEEAVKEVKKKKQNKETEKVMRVKPKIDLEAFTKELKDFEVTIYDKETSYVEAPYIIPFRSLALQFITGGIMGGRMLIS